MRRLIPVSWCSPLGCVTTTGPAAPQEGWDAPATDETGVLSIGLESSRACHQGFEVVLRVETADGQVLDSVLWTDFVQSLGATTRGFLHSGLRGGRPRRCARRLAEVNVGIARRPRSDLEGDLPCELPVEVGAGERVEVEVSFDGSTECLRLARTSSPSVGNRNQPVTRNVPGWQGHLDSVSSPAPDVGRGTIALRLLFEVARPAWRWSTYRCDGRRVFTNTVFGYLAPTSSSPSRGGRGGRDRMGRGHPRHLAFITRLLAARAPSASRSWPSGAHRRRLRRHLPTRSTSRRGGWPRGSGPRPTRSGRGIPHALGAVVFDS